MYLAFIKSTYVFLSQCISASHEFNPTRRVGINHNQIGLSPSELEESSSDSHTTIELTGGDRPGLMSEISALLAEMRCNVVAAELWTHNMRVACLLYVTDEEATNGPIKDKDKLYRIKESLSNVLKGDKNLKSARTDFAHGVITHTERRLHQMMFADRDYEREIDDEMWDLDGKISVEDCNDKGYSVVNVECRNRPKLLFDALCPLTDMEYVIFHATIDTDGHRAFQVCGWIM